MAGVASAASTERARAKTDGERTGGGMLQTVWGDGRRMLEASIMSNRGLLMAFSSLTAASYNMAHRDSTRMRAATLGPNRQPHAIEASGRLMARRLLVGLGVGAPCATPFDPMPLNPMRVGGGFDRDGVESSAPAGTASKEGGAPSATAAVSGVSEPKTRQPDIGSKRRDAPPDNGLTTTDGAGAVVSEASHGGGGQRSTSDGEREKAVGSRPTPRHLFRIADTLSVPPLERRRRLSTEVSSFSALSSAIASDADINVVGNIAFTGVITISGKTNVKISSSTGRVLTSKRSFSNSYGGMFYVESGSDVTFTGLGFASGSASSAGRGVGSGGGCFYATGSTIEMEDVDFTSCYAYVRHANKPHQTKPHIHHRHHPTNLLTPS